MAYTTTADSLKRNHGAPRTRWSSIRVANGCRAIFLIAAGFASIFS